nr:exodeoxyribonuclease VII small subunit [bacterium]
MASKQIKTGQAPDDAGFEETLQALETLVDTLKAENLPLEQALLAYERGMALAGRCEALLAAAQKRVAVLLEDNREGDMPGGDTYDAD